MRAIQSYVLRILADADEPGVLRGSLRPVSGEAEYPFADGLGLLALLNQLVKPGNDAPARSTGEADGKVAPTERS
ncbi:MAG: hypothetical protein M1482_03245 [Chloroflexi bacterium]|nr:hypothetical protein [Chloroflexota bacterium]